MVNDFKIAVCEKNNRGRSLVSKNLELIGRQCAITAHCSYHLCVSPHRVYHANDTILSIDNVCFCTELIPFVHFCFHYSALDTNKKYSLVILLVSFASARNDCHRAVVRKQPVSSCL